LSFYTGTQNELLYSFYGAATTSVVSASAVTITAGYPEIAVPANFMSALGKRSSSLKLKLGGFITATATVPTFSFGLAYTPFSTSPAFASTPVLATTTNTVTPSAGSGSFKMEVEIGLRAMGLGQASTVVTHGSWDSNLTTTNLQLAPGGSGNTVTNWQSDNEYYLWPFILLGAATTGNTVTVQYAKLYGEN
jgi:hypothetical protein